MGGIRLDWEVESDRIKLEEKEDPSLKLARRLGFLRLLFVVALVMVLIGFVAAYIAYRLDQFDTALEQSLRDTIESEVAALRFGDQETFIGLQRSATDDWYRTQGLTFESYQTQKSDQDIQLTGRILDTHIDEPRARVHVEEIVDGVPYTHIWYYWRYEDGWHHVPPDYTFWGESRNYVGEGFVIRYQSVDETLAQNMGVQIDSWIRFACTTLVCGPLPYITIDILPEQDRPVRWISGEAWQLVIPSPYVDGSRSDVPFNVNLQIETGTLIADRIVGFAMSGRQPAYPADVYYLRSAIVSWLVGRFVQIDTNSFVMDSLASQYGGPAIGRLVQSMQPSSDMSILANITGLPIEQSNLDWRDFLTWRLVTEDDLIARRDESNWLALYDTRDDVVRVTAYSRYNNPPSPESKVVTIAQLQVAPDGTPQLKAIVRAGSGDILREEIVLFNLVNGVWKRSS